MILYHYTSLGSLPAILREGLRRGEVPLSYTCVLNATNLTTSPSPSGHGVFEARTVTVTPYAREYLRKAGTPVPDGIQTMQFADKTAVRITVKLLSSDRDLTRWLPWARKRLEPAFLRYLHKVAGSYRTWWLCWRVIGPEEFVAVEMRGDDGKWHPWKGQADARDSATPNVLGLSGGVVTHVQFGDGTWHAVGREGVQVAA